MAVPCTLITFFLSLFFRRCFFVRLFINKLLNYHFLIQVFQRPLERVIRVSNANIRYAKDVKSRRGASARHPQHLLVLVWPSQLVSFWRQLQESRVLIFGVDRQSIAVQTVCVLCHFLWSCLRASLVSYLCLVAATSCLAWSSNLICFALVGCYVGFNGC